MSHHGELGLFNALSIGPGDLWRARGYDLVAVPGGYDIAGDQGQFYMDAVAADAAAHLAMEFLRDREAPLWCEMIEIAAADGIDLVESQDIFLQGRSLPDQIRATRLW